MFHLFGLTVMNKQEVENLTRLSSRKGYEHAVKDLTGGVLHVTWVDSVKAVEQAEEILRTREG